MQICTNATILINDKDGSKYRKTYFEKYPGVWHHGDFKVIKEGIRFMVEATQKKPEEQESGLLSYITLLMSFLISKIAWW